MGVFFLGYLMVAKLYRYKHFDEDQDGQEGQSIEASSSSQRKPAERFGSDTGFWESLWFMFKPRITGQRLRVWYPMEVLTVLCLLCFCIVGLLIQVQVLIICLFPNFEGNRFFWSSLLVYAGSSVLQLLCCAGLQTLLLKYSEKVNIMVLYGVDLWWLSLKEEGDSADNYFQALTELLNIYTVFIHLRSGVPEY